MSISSRESYEETSLIVALNSYLIAHGWTGGMSDIIIRPGFQSDSEIIPPMIGTYFLPSRFYELQMGKDPSQKSLNRRIQIDCYMESESRAKSITETVGDFLDETTITILDNDSNAIGVLYCPDSEEISMEILPPLLPKPKVIRWRGIVTAPTQSHYNL